MSDAAESTAAEEPRWLTPDERAAWLATAAALMIRLPAALDAQMQRDSELTFFEYNVLSILSEQDDRTMQMSDLAGLGFSSLSRLSHVVARLEREGLVTRERLPGKGRRTNAILTDAGFERVVAAAPLHVEAVRRFLIDALTQGELEALASIGDKVMLRIDPEQGPIPRR